MKAIINEYQFQKLITINNKTIQQGTLTLMMEMTQFHS